MSDQTLQLMSLAEHLEAFIQTVVSEAVTVQKYGGTLFTLKPEQKEGQFCGVFIYKTHVQLSFSQGARLEDPEKLLRGTGKHRRHINFLSADELDFDALETLLKQAAQF
jgi:hypothetical protein